MGEAVVPLPSSNPPLPPPSAEVVSTVRAELVRREGQMQDSILSLMPLLKFTSAEFDFGRAFDVATLSRVVRSHQLILGSFIHPSISTEILTVCDRSIARE
jgi:hypothetical protein